MVELIKKNWYLAIYLLLSIFSINPLLSPGFFPIHDDTQVARVFEMAKALSGGMFPVRWVEDLGYGFGYPIFNFYSILPYYIGAVITNFGIDALSSTKVVFALALILSGISMYLLVKQFFGKIPALASSIVYLYFPYHAVNTYARGDLAELSAYAFLPPVFLSLFKIHESKTFSKNYVVLGSLSIAAVILSHNLSFFMLFIFIAIFILSSLILTKNKKNLFAFGLVLILSFLLSAFYAVPAILEMQYTNIVSIIGGGADYKDHFICLPQLWDSPWGFGGSAKGCLDGMTFKLGKLNIILVLLSLGVFFLNFKKLKDKRFYVSFSFIALFLSVFMTVEYSSFIWRLPFMDFLQFPWRFLNFSGLFISIAAGFLVWQFKERLGDNISLVFISIIIFITLILNARLFNPQTIHDRKSSFYTNDTYLKWTVSKISDEYLPRNFTKPSQDVDLRESPFDIVDGGGKLEVLVNKTQENTAKVNLLEDGTIRANIAYFPAWKFYINDRESPYIIRDDGLYISLQKGQHIVMTKFVQTPIEKVGNLLSLIGLLGIIIVIIPYGKKAS